MTAGTTLSRSCCLHSVVWAVFQLPHAIENVQLSSDTHTNTPRLVFLSLWGLTEKAMHTYTHKQILVGSFTDTCTYILYTLYMHILYIYYLQTAAVTCILHTHIQWEMQQQQLSFLLENANIYFFLSLIFFHAFFVLCCLLFLQTLRHRHHLNVKCSAF